MATEGETGTPSGAVSLTPTLAEARDRICDRFEAGWRSGRRPELSSYLAGMNWPRSAGARQPGPARPASPAQTIRWLGRAQE